MKRLSSWLRHRTPVLRRMYPLALPFLFVAIAVWTIVSPRAALLLSIMALTVVGIIVGPGRGRTGDR